MYDKKGDSICFHVTSLLVGLKGNPRAMTSVEQPITIQFTVIGLVGQKNSIINMLDLSWQSSSIQISPVHVSRDILSVVQKIPDYFNVFEEKYVYSVVIFKVLYDWTSEKILIEFGIRNGLCLVVVQIQLKSG